MAGRPTAYKPEMLEQAKEYIEGGYKELEQVIPSVVGLAIHLKVAKSTIYKWCEDKDHPFSDTLAFVNESQELRLVNGGLSGELNSNITKLALGNFGYSDKQATDLTSGGKPVKNEWHIHPVTTRKDAEG